MHSTTSTTKCLLMNESPNNRPIQSSTSALISSTSSVAKYFPRTKGGTISTMTRAHSRLIARVSTSEGGTRAGPRASSGKMARLTDCKAGGRWAAFRTRVWMVWERSLCIGRCQWKGSLVRICLLGARLCGERTCEMTAEVCDV